MQWGRQQEAALNKIGRWLAGPARDGRQLVFKMNGFAGSGKTTLAKHVAEMAGGQVEYLTPTGKAADVLRRKGCQGAATVHSKIYKVMRGNEAVLRGLLADHAELKLEMAQASEEEMPELRKKLAEIDKEIEAEKESSSALKFQLDPESVVRDASLLIVDEGSMFDSKVAEDLCSFKVPILAMGDPFQLPPPFSSSSPFTDDNPDVLLTEVHRQAQDNPVLWLSMQIREQRRCPMGRHGESLVETRRKMEAEELKAASQLLVGRNATRLTCNKRHRQLLGIDTLAPVKGDRLVCLKNNRELGLFNGQQWIVDEPGELSGDGRLMTLINQDEGGDPVQVFVAEEGFWAEKAPRWIDYGLSLFTYSYALTVHKAQGSEWPAPIVWGDWGGDDYWRWLYTAVTRGRDRVHVLL